MRKVQRKRNCNYCEKNYTFKRNTSKYCSDICRAHSNIKKSKDGFKEMIKEIKVDYPKMTFRLSVFGFIASVAFYFGVLIDLTEPKDAKDKKIEQMERENKQLGDQIELLNEKLDAK